MGLWAFISGGEQSFRSGIKTMTKERSSPGSGKLPGGPRRYLLRPLKIDTEQAVVEGRVSELVENRTPEPVDNRASKVIENRASEVVGSRASELVENRHQKWW